MESLQASARQETVDGYGTHKKVLKRAIELTIGPVLELGTGFHSTPLIHDLCAPKQRPVVSVDESEEWLQKFEQYRTDWHVMVRVPYTVNGQPDWNMVPYQAARWGVALVDQHPTAGRLVSISALADYCDLIVVHDTDCPTYYYEMLLKTFKYRFDYKSEMPYTTVVSNTMPFTMGGGA